MSENNMSNNEFVKPFSQEKRKELKKDYDEHFKELSDTAKAKKLEIAMV